MQRRLFTVLGVVLLVGFVYTLGAQVTHWESTVHATPVSDVDEAADYYDSTELSPPCRQFARALAAGHDVSTSGYRFTTREMTVIVKKTTLSDGWRLANVICTDGLGNSDALRPGIIRIDDQYYELGGFVSVRSGCPDATREDFEVFVGCGVLRLLQLSLLLLGGGLLVYGRTER